VDRLNRWLTLLANIGVIVGIAFLAIEIQQNTESLDESRNLAFAQAQQERLTQLDESFRSLANSDYLPEIFVKYARDGLSGLSPEERQRFVWQSCSGVFRLDTFHAWYERGYVEEGEYQTEFKEVVLYFAPRWREIGIWPLRPAFRRDVERVLTEAGQPLLAEPSTPC